jgi:hypothetical protein
LKAKNEASSNKFKTANYGLMIYDKQRDAFRLVPIHRHLAFEKQKFIDRNPEKLKPQVVQTAKGWMGSSLTSGSKSQPAKGIPVSKLKK